MSNEPFEIDSEECANWLLKQYHRIESERQLIQAQAAALLARLDTDKQALERQFQSGLEHWARQQIAADPKGRKSLILMYGTLATRKVPMSAHVVDEKAAIDHIHYSSDLVFKRLVEVRTTLILDKKGYIALMKQTGEALPGIEITPERDAFSVKFADGGKEE